ncbi:MAG: hypothetical protein J6Q67_01370 [Clostridia bacterium]|nr:hypothetical protein [Clostridia bacterium]
MSIRKSFENINVLIAIIKQKRSALFRADREKRGLAAAVITATVTATIAVTTAAENDYEKNDNPAAVAGTESITHVFFLLSHLLSYFMKKREKCENMCDIKKARKSKICEANR